jgi:hypothetical protein
MSLAQSKIAGVATLFVLACGACRTDLGPAQGSVQFASAPPLGTWQDPMPGSNAGPNASAPVAAGSGGGIAPSGTAGSSDVGSTSGAAGLTGASDAGMTGMPTTGAGGSGGAPSAETGGSGSSADAGSTGMTGTSGIKALSFNVVSVSQGGRYAPRNVGAIWIETASGQFVKTLKVWAGTRGRYLSKFNNEAGGSRVDAVTSATLRSYMAHQVSWDLTDVNGTRAANGSYQVVIEITDHDGPGKSATAPFELMDMPMSWMPADAQYFTGMQLNLQ